MKLSFTEFNQSLLNEMLKVDEKTNTVTYSMQSQKFGSSSEEIDTYTGRGFYNEHSASSGGIDIYSCYLYKHGPKITQILQALKGTGPLTVPEKTANNFLKNTAKHAAELIKAKKIDTIVFPKSSSAFLQSFVDEIRLQLGSHPINIIADAIIKKQIKDIEADKGDMTELINFDHKSFNTLKPATIKALEKQIAKNIKDNEAAGKGRVVSVKDINKMQAKFVHNFMELVKSLSDDLDSKNVMLIDDVLSSGATFAEMVRVLQKENIKSLIGLTIFKNTATTVAKKT